jgi:high frequency lysogenization protein
LNLRDRTLALAGVFQAALLVRQLAHDGRADNESFSSSVNSVLMIDADNTDAVFGGVRGVRAGLELLRDRLASTGETLNAEIAGYVVSIAHLAARLHAHSDMQHAIREGILTAERQMRFFETEDGDVHPNLVEKLAELYVQTLSTIGPRIIVTGEHGYLINPSVAAKVRAALLAGVRAAFLWRQLGGRRWHLLLSRRPLIAESGRLLNELQHD